MDLIYTLARPTQITRNPFLIAESIEKWINEKNKKESFLFTLILSLDFILPYPDMSIDH